MKKVLLLVVLLAIGVGGYLYYRSLSKGPKYALMQAVVATQTHNIDTFERYVDVRSVAGSLVDQVANQEQELGLPKLRLGGLDLKDALRMLKPQLAEMAREEVQQFVKKGSVQGGSPGAPRQMNISLAGLVGKVTSVDSRFKEVKYVNQQGDQALVGIEFTQPKYDTTMVVELKMHNLGDHWQVKEITNTSALLKQAARLEKQRP